MRPISTYLLLLFIIKLQRCQSQRRDMQITAEIMQTYDLLKFAIALSNGSTLLKFPPYNTT